MNEVHVVVFMMPSILPLWPDTTTMDEFVTKYFKVGHSYEIINNFLAIKHKISLSLNSQRENSRCISSMFFVCLFYLF